MQKIRKNTWVIIIFILLLVTLSLPPVWSRVAFHSREAYRNVKYWLKPPSEAVFVPSTTQDNNLEFTSVSAASPAGLPMPHPTTQLTAIPTQSTPSGSFALTDPTIDSDQSTPEATFTTTPTSPPSPTPMPSSVLLKGISGEQQSMNNCGPATLSMNLSYYDWGKDQNAVGAVVKPNGKDVNVMPYELVDFVNQHTDLRALWRYGGDLQTIRALLNIGLPVMIEKSFEPYDLRKEGWMGHYNLVVGYDDERQSLTVQDSYLMIHTPWGLEIPRDMWDTFIGFDFSYSELEQAWRSFNFVFIVVYPPEKEKEVLNTIGVLANEEAACRSAYERAMQETSSTTEVRDQFFAWFNAGTSLVCLQDYGNAASAYDSAFEIYPDIHYNSRPYRILWYETGPYPAYYYSERYQDVIDLADQTLEYVAEPVMEESYYWRALSYNALGNTTRAVDDLRTSLKYHPGFAPSLNMLKQLGKTP